MDACAMAEETAGKNLRVVQYQTVAGLEKLRQVAKQPVFPALRGAVKHEHARGGAIRQWLLCDQILRKIVGEIGKAHASTNVAQLNTPSAALKWRV